MSLEQLKNMRIHGYKPKSVTVLVGNIPAWLEEDATTVCVTHLDNVRNMDLRALVGLPVSIIQLGDCDPLLIQTISAVDAVKPESVSIAANKGIVGLSREHERVLESIKRRYSCSS